MGPPEQGRRLDRRGGRGRLPLPRRALAARREVAERTEPGGRPTAPRGRARELLAKAHWAIDKVTRDFDRGFQFNTAIAAVMELVNEVYRLKDGLYEDPTGAAASLRDRDGRLADLPLRAAPRHRGLRALTGERVWEQPWPEADPELLEPDTFTLVVQVNGKLRDRIEAEADAPEDELLELARASEKVQQHLDGKEVVKEVVVPGSS